MGIVEDRLRDALPRLNRLGHAVRFAIGGDGDWIVDGCSAPARLMPDDDREVASTIRISAENLLKLLDGSMDPMVGYSLGRIKVSGSKGVALKLVSALS